MRFDWYSTNKRGYDLSRKPCICCGDSSHSVIHSYRDGNYNFKREYGCPVISGTEPDPSYTGADTDMYLVLTLDPKTFAKLYHYNVDDVREFFKRDNKLIVHPVRVKLFQDMVLEECDTVRRSWNFKREIRKELDDEDELSSDDDSQL